MNYAVVIHKARGTDYGVSVPDLPGCITAGRTLDEALALAKEAIELHVEGLIEEGQVVPEPHPLEEHQANPDYRGGTWAIVCIDPSKLRVHATRINITMPKRVLQAVDRAAKSEGQTRSGLLAKAAVAYMAGKGEVGKGHARKKRR